MRWQLIDSAPKDGTAILAYGHYVTPEIGSILVGFPSLKQRTSTPLIKQIQWHEPCSYPKYEEVSGGLFKRTVEPGGPGYWGSPVTEAMSSFLGKWEPSHWMPLPEPPGVVT